MYIYSYTSSKIYILIYICEGLSSFSVLHHHVDIIIDKCPRAYIRILVVGGGQFREKK